MAHLVTGYAGYEHIQSEDDGAFNAAFFGSGQYVMAFGNQFEGSIIDNNTVRILDGDGLMYGRHFRIKPNIYEDVTITTGTAGMNRTDLIVMTYEKNENDGTEQVYLQVIKGPECEGTATVPENTNGNILEGATFNQMPLYKVSISGVVLEDIEPMFKVIKTYKQLYEESVESFKKSCETHLDSLGVLDTMEEIEANTQANQLAGALAVKEMQVEHDENIKLINTNLTDIGKGFYVYNTAQLTLSQGDNLLNFDAADWNDGYFANDTFYVPRDGIYAFSSLMQFSVVQETQVAVFFKINGVTTAYINKETISTGKIFRSDYYAKLLKNDTVQVCVYANNATTLLGAGCSLMGELMRIL